MIDVVGLGDAGWDALDGQAQALVRDARVLLGGRRHLDLVPARPGQDRRPWPSPLRAGLTDLLAEVDADAGGVVALASGDPLRAGIATSLVDLFGSENVRTHPALSSDTLARARMGWSAESTEVVTTVGRDLRAVVPHLVPGARLVVLCSDGTGPARLAELLTGHGLGATTLTARWHLGGPDEGARSARADVWDATPAPDLVLACLEVRADDASGYPFAAIGPAPGRPEDAFDHDGQITKRDVRASALAHLRPAPGAHLWDLGAGNGSIGLEWCLAAPRATCTAVERDPARAARVRANADTLGIGPRLTVVTGDSHDPVVLAGLPAPDAVFIGGGLDVDLAERAWSALRPGGRLVAHAVTLETEAVLADLAGRIPAQLTRLAVEHARPLGRYLSWTPLRPVVQLSAVATGES